MHAFMPRAGRRSLARTIVVLSAAGALGACVDETTAPAPNAPSRVAANAAARSPEQLTTSVDLTVGRVAISPVYGTTVRLAITCSAQEVFDIIVDLEQEQKPTGRKTLAKGSTTFDAITCSDAAAAFVVGISPYTGTFQPGRATVRARIANYQPWVEPTDVTRRVRIIAE